MAVQLDSAAGAILRATLEDLELMRKHSPERVQVKAAGGVSVLDMLQRVREIGVTRVGASRTKAMLDECRELTPPLRRRDGEQAPLAGHALELVSAALLELEP